MTTNQNTDSRKPPNISLKRCKDVQMSSLRRCEIQTTSHCSTSRSHSCSLNMHTGAMHLYKFTTHLDIHDLFNALTIAVTWWLLIFARAIRFRPLYSRFSTQPWKFLLDVAGFWELRLWTAPRLSCVGAKTQKVVGSWNNTSRFFMCCVSLSKLQECPRVVFIFKLNLEVPWKWRVCRVVSWFHYTCWMSQLLNSAGTWTLLACLSTVRLWWELCLSITTWCHCWSSNKLPREARLCGLEVELPPENNRRVVQERRQLCIWPGKRVEHPV